MATTRHPARPRRNHAEIEARLARKEAEGLTYDQLSAVSCIPASTLARWGMWIGRERRQAAAASQAGARCFVEGTTPLERDPKRGIEQLVGGSHRIAIERNFDETTVQEDARRGGKGQHARDSIRRRRVTASNLRSMAIRWVPPASSPMVQSMSPSSAVVATAPS